MFEYLNYVNGNSSCAKEKELTIS